MNRATTEKNLDNQLWKHRNCASQGDPTVTDAESTVSAKVLDRYTSEENLAKLFHSKEQAESLAELSASLLATYPNYPYHQPAHGVDVMHSTRLLTDVIPEDKMSSDQKDLLLVAAAAHDAGLAVGPPPYGYSTKEHYAVSFLGEQYEPNSAEYEFMKRAILGTIIGPKERVCRDSIEAKLLHHADLGYIWGANNQDFLNYATRFRVEGCSNMSWQEFQELESVFLSNYQDYLENDMRACGVAEEVIKWMLSRVEDNKKFITSGELGEPSQEVFNNWPTACADRLSIPGNVGKIAPVGNSVSF